MWLTDYSGTSAVGERNGAGIADKKVSAIECLFTDPVSMHAIQSALINIYVVYGEIKEVHKIFDIISEWDMVSRTTIIVRYAQNDLLVRPSGILKGRPQPSVTLVISIIVGYAQMWFIDKAEE